MLDLTVAMMQILFALLIVFFQESSIAITSPGSGETLRGQINIAGNMNVTNFASAELAFAYESDQTSTWFTIQTFSTPIVDPSLFTWDTTTLTDDDYTLRLRVYLQDGSFQESVVKGLKIRNDIPLPTDTPTLQADPVSVSPLLTSTPVPATVISLFPTPTTMPTNPASLTTPTIYSTFGRGALFALVLFFVIGLFLRLRRS
jgi:hypothetical protein